jgi:uncharacterized protein (DUF58 family)
VSGAAAPSASPIHWRPAAIVLLGVGILLAAAAIATRDPVPLFLALPFLIAPVAAGIDLGNVPDRLRLAWTEEGTGAELVVAGSLSGASVEMRDRLALTIDRPHPLEESGSPRVTSEGDRLCFRLAWTAPHPCLATVPVPRVVARDRLGLAERDIPVEGEPLRVDRYPPEVTRVGAIHLRRTTPIPGEVRSRSIGRSGEFFSLREVGPGDTRRQVNWRATARAGRLLANDFLADRTGDLLIVLDVRATSLGLARDETLLAVSRAAAHGVATAFLREKARVGVAVYGEFLAVVPLGSGRAHGYRIARFLDAARVSISAGPDERLAVSLRRYYPPGVSTLLITPFADDESIGVLPHLRHRGFTTVVLSPSPIPLLVRPAELRDEDDRLALRLMKLVRRQRMSNVWKEAPVLDWEEYWSLAGLRGLFAGPRAGGRRP